MAIADTREALAEVELSSDPADPAHQISACIGAPDCAASLGDTHAAAQSLRRRGGSQRVHLSGCEKRCGAGVHGTAATTEVRIADASGAFVGAGANA